MNHKIYSAKGSLSPIHKHLALYGTPEVTFAVINRSIVGRRLYLEDEEVLGLDEDTQGLQVCLVLGGGHHLLWCVCVRVRGGCVCGGGGGD